MSQLFTLHNSLRHWGANTRRSDKWRDPVVLLVVFLLALGVYGRSDGGVPMTDMVWTVPIALSLIHEGNLDLDEFHYAHGDGRLRNVGEHWISYFPTSGSVVIAPIVALIERTLHSNKSQGLYEHLKYAPDWDLVASLNHGIASLFAALTVTVIYLTSRLALNRSRALFLAAIVAFGTSLWSTASRDLWQHTISVFAVAWVIYFLLRARDRSPWVLFWCGLATALAYVTRPTNSLLVLLATAYIVIEHRWSIFFFLAGAAVIAAPFMLYNLEVFGSLLAPYFRPDRIGSSPLFWEAMAGNVISPARGLLVYSPLLLFSMYGIALKVYHRQFQRLDAFLVAVIVLHWLAISSFRHWWGGASYGPRFWTDLLPIFAYFLIPVVNQVTTSTFWMRWPGRVIGALFVASIVWSIFVHYRGSTQLATWHWNGSYPKVVASVDEDPTRLWDWSDPQFWRGLRPAAPAVEPAVLCRTAQEGDTLITGQTLTLINRGDKPYIWTLETPNRVFKEAAYDQVPGLGYGEPQLTVDTSRLVSGDHPLGGLYLITRTENGQPVKGSPLIVPVTVRVLPANAQETDERTADPTTCVAAPSGIVINGQDRPFDPSQPFAVYGSGWYDRETAGEISWRWATSPARILIFVPQRLDVTLSSTPTALHDQEATKGFGDRGTMRVSTDGRLSVETPVQTGQPFAIELSLQPGWNIINLELLAGNVRPIDVDPSTGDARLLSYALGPIEIRQR